LDLKINTIDSDVAEKLIKFRGNGKDSPLLVLDTILSIDSDVAEKLANFNGTARL